MISPLLPEAPRAEPPRPKVPHAKALHPGALYAEALDGALVEVESADGTTRPLESWRWLDGAEGDEAMLARCADPTLDVGSGPGRLTVALTRRGVRALGIDVAPRAVRLTRLAGGRALCRDVFGHVPGAGRWGTVLLADGNIGIGGDPDALLRRVRDLLRPGGEVVAELDPPGTATRALRVRLRREGRVTGWFAWARVGVSGIVPLARSAGFRRTEVWTEAGRWFSVLR
ncbi:methyltransferase domain-containing protein [Microbispora sp. NPDC088329]|uniref:methyltransferase domain-containing protein n=1 Tax=Microbispora sp. NPDC088329 TaxID=3154869 RepID=UPI0034370FC5